MLNNTENNEEIDTVKINTNIKTYRYNFSPEFIEQISYFSKKYQYEDRQKFKEEYNLWRLENTEIIEIEKNKLKQNGYKGDVDEKIYYAMRYYFRKKEHKNKNNDKQKRNDYLKIDKYILNSIDEYIYNNLDLKPEDSFKNFCKEEHILNRIIQKYINNNIKDKETIIYKIKKLYKNRVYLVCKTLKKKIITNEEKN